MGTKGVFSIPKVDSWGLLKQNVYCTFGESLLQDSTNCLTNIDGEPPRNAPCKDLTTDLLYSYSTENFTKHACTL